MKDLLPSSMSFKVESILSFILCPSSFIQRKSLILYPNSVLNPLSKRHSESKMDEKKDFLKKDTRTLSYATLKNNEEGVSK